MATPAATGTSAATALLLKAVKDILGTLAAAGETEALMQIHDFIAEVTRKPRKGHYLTKFEQELLIEALTQIDAHSKAQKRAEDELAALKAAGPMPADIALNVGDKLDFRRDSAGDIKTVFSKARGIAFDVVRDSAGNPKALKIRDLEAGAK